MPPESLPAGRSRNGREPGAVEQLGDAPARDPRGPGRTGAPKKSMFSNTDSVEIEILAQPLRHVGDARRRRRRCRRSRMSPPSTSTVPLLDLAHAGDQAEQRRLADAVGADQADHRAARELQVDPVDGHASHRSGGSRRRDARRRATSGLKASPAPACVSGHGASASMRTPGDARHARLETRALRRGQARVETHLGAEHELLALAPGLDLLRGELGARRDEGEPSPAAASPAANRARCARALRSAPGRRRASRGRRSCTRRPCRARPAPSRRRGRISPGSARR